MISLFVHIKKLQYPLISNIILGVGRWCPVTWYGFQTYPIYHLFPGTVQMSAHTPI